MYHFCNGKEFNQKDRSIGSFIFKIFFLKKAFQWFLWPKLNTFSVMTNLGAQSFVACYKCRQAAGVLRLASPWLHSTSLFTAGGISTHHGRCGIQEAHDLHLNVILAKALQHFHNLTQRQPLTIHVLNGNNIIPFLGSCLLKNIYDFNTGQHSVHWNPCSSSQVH